MATNKAANKAPAPKAPERKRVKDYTCRGCEQTVSSRKSLAVRIGDKVERYCLHCAVTCDLCHTPTLKANIIGVDGWLLCPACRAPCSVCGMEHAKRVLRTYQGKLLCSAHFGICEVCKQSVPHDHLADGICPGCRATCVFCGTVRVRSTMVHVPSRKGYCCTRHRLVKCTVCEKEFADISLRVVDHPNRRKGKVAMCPDCAPTCFICGKPRHTSFLAYKNCDVHGFRYVCLEHKIGEKHGTGGTGGGSPAAAGGGLPAPGGVAGDGAGQGKPDRPVEPVPG